MSNVSDQKSPPVVADPGPLGLFGLAMITFVASTQKLGWTSGYAFILPWAIFLGCIAQIIACIYDFKHNNLFGATVFGAYGLFWLAIAMCWAIKTGAMGPLLASMADPKQLGIAFIGYFIFSVFGTVAALKTNKAIFAIMVLIDVLFLALAADVFRMGPAWGQIAAWVEMLISLLGFYASGATFLNKWYGKSVLPLGRPIPIL